MKTVSANGYRSREISFSALRTKLSSLTSTVSVCVKIAAVSLVWALVYSRNQTTPSCLHSKKNISLRNGIHLDLAKKTRSQLEMKKKTVFFKSSVLAGIEVSI